MMKTFLFTQAAFITNPPKKNKKEPVCRKLFNADPQTFEASHSYIMWNLLAYRELVLVS